MASAPPAMRVDAARIVFSADDRAEIARRVDESLRTGRLTLGANTREFEAAFAAMHSARYAVAVSSGTAALEIVLRSLGVAGHDVVMPTNTFAATAFAALAAGARPVFADIDADTFALTVDTVRAALTPNTAAVVVVHVGGLISPDVIALRDLCRQHGIALIEDAAHAHGSTYRGNYAGSFGVAATFSFYPTKVVTSGEGGMIVTADDRISADALAYRDQGKAAFDSNLHTRVGSAWRMSELHAAVGLVHLRRLAGFLRARDRVAQRYRAGLESIDAVRPLPVPAGCGSNYYKYIVLLDDGIDRPTLKSRLREEFSVSLAGEVYETPLHQQPVFASHDSQPGQRLPVAERVCARHVCLPLHSDMTDSEVDRVLTALAAAVPQL